MMNQLEFLAAFDARDPKGAELYKAFTDERFREVTICRLKGQVVTERLCVAEPPIWYCPVAGEVRPGD